MFKDFIASGGKGLLDCKHVHPGQTCLQYDYWKLKNVFIAAAKVFTVTTLVSALFRWKAYKNKPKQECKKALIAFIRSTLFLALACSLPPILNCYMQRWFGYTGRLPGLLSQVFGVSWVAIESTQRQREIGVFLLPKAVQSIWNGLVNRGLIPEIKGLETFIVMMAIGLIGQHGAPVAQLVD